MPDPTRDNRPFELTPIARRIVAGFQPPAQPPGPPVEANARLAPSRRGLKAITFHVDPTAHIQLRLLTIEFGRSGHAICRKALDDYFEKKGKPRLENRHHYSE